MEKVWRAIGGRKFLGFVFASVLCWFGKISDVIWFLAFLAYVSLNVLQKAIERGGFGVPGKTS